MCNDPANFGDDRNVEVEIYIFDLSRGLVRLHDQVSCDFIGMTPSMYVTTLLRLVVIDIVVEKV